MARRTSRQRTACPLAARPALCAGGSSSWLQSKAGQPRPDTLRLDLRGRPPPPSLSSGEGCVRRPFLEQPSLPRVHALKRQMHPLPHSLHPQRTAGLISGRDATTSRGVRCVSSFPERERCPPRGQGWASGSKAPCGGGTPLIWKRGGQARLCGLGARGRGHRRGGPLPRSARASACRR